MSEMERIVPRLVEADENSKVFTAAHLILTVPAPLERVDSFAVTPGLGEHRRVVAAVKAWQSHKNARHLMVTGTYKGEVTQPQLTLERLQEEPFGLQRTDGVLTQVEAKHTRVQTDWVIEQVKRYNVTSMALFVSDWHMPRAYRAMLKSMLNAELKIPIFSVAIGSPPNTIVPEYGETTARMSAGEAQRIKEYEAIGQIASFDEVTAYLNWLWEQQVVPINPLANV